MEKFNLESEDKKTSRKMQGKRLLANYDTCKMELRNEILLLFNTYQSAIEKAKHILFELPKGTRARGTEASIVQSCFAEELFLNFGSRAFYGKHRRLVLVVKGYVILFKKLNNKGMPMNIQTSNIQSILNQNMTSDLFTKTDYGEDPILYFGYQQNKIGEHVNPQLIYIDEGSIDFTISINDFYSEVKHFNNADVTVDNVTEVMPSLKNGNSVRRVI